MPQATPATWVLSIFVVFLVWSLVAVVACSFAFGLVGYALIGKSLLAKLWLNLGAVILELWLLGLAANGRLPGARRRAVQETSTLS